MNSRNKKRDPENRAKDIENLFTKIIAKEFPQIGKDTDIQV